MSTALAPGRALTIVRHAFDAGGACIRDRNTDAFMASCPLHDDLNPSLSVTWKTRPNREGGAVLMHCFSCNAGAADIAAALGLSMADLFDDPAAPNAARAPRPTTPLRRRPAPRNRHAPRTESTPGEKSGSTPTPPQPVALCCK